MKNAFWKVAFAAGAVLAAGVSFSCKAPDLTHNVTYYYDQQEIQSYVQEFIDEEARNIADVTVLPESIRFKPAEGKKLGGWTTNSNASLGTAEYAAKESLTFNDPQDAVFAPTSDMNLYAVWVDKEDYTITYKLDGGVQSPNNVIRFAGSDDVKLYQPTREGYTFLGWYKKYNKVALSGTKETVYDEAAYSTAFTDLVEEWKRGENNKDTTVYAKWAVTEFNISYYDPKAQYGDDLVKAMPNPTSYRIIDDDIVLNPPTTFADGTPAYGYKFQGWYTTYSEKDDLYYNQVEKIAAGSTGEIKLYAKWEAVPAPYIVNHYKQKSFTRDNINEKLADSDYPAMPNDVDQLTGLTGDLTEAVAKDYTGFHAVAFDQEVIKGDGSTVINIYYNRNEVTLTFYGNRYIKNPTYDPAETDDTSDKFYKYICSPDGKDALNVDVSTLTGLYGEKVDLTKITGIGDFDVDAGGTPTVTGAAEWKEGTPVWKDHSFAEWQPPVPSTFPAKDFDGYEAIWSCTKIHIRIINPTDTDLIVGTSKTTNAITVTAPIADTAKDYVWRFDDELSAVKGRTLTLNEDELRIDGVYPVYCYYVLDGIPHSSYVRIVVEN